MRFISLLLILGIFGFICEEEQDDNTQEKIRTEEENSFSNEVKGLGEKTDNIIDLYPDSLILVKRLSKSDPAVYNAVLELEKAIKTSDKITDDKGLLELLALRDKLDFAISNSGVFDNVYDDEGQPTYETAFHDFQQEMSYLGFNELWAEGFYFGLDKGLFLEDLFEEKASEPLKLRTRILNLISYTNETEYPYLNLSEESEIIYLGEQMFAKYPGHKYTPEIQKHFENALYTLFDFHSMCEEEGSIYSYLNFGLSTRGYPYWTEIDNRELFIKDYSDSKYAPLMKKVLANISSIDIEKDSIYIVKVPCESTNITIFLDKGFDIPHEIELRDTAGVLTEVICAYRFYSDKVKAEQALKIIAEKIPGSKIVVQRIDRSF